MSNERIEFKEVIISIIHGMPYDDALEKEHYTKLVEEMYMDGTEETIKETCYGFQITLGRLMQALRDNYCFWNDCIRKLNNEYGQTIFEVTDLVCAWKSIKENGQECTDVDQTDEDISKLLKVLKNDRKTDQSGV